MGRIGGKMTRQEFNSYFTPDYPRVTLDRMRVIQGEDLETGEFDPVDPLAHKVDVIFGELKSIEDELVRVCLKLNLSFLIQAKYN